ncbi:MAG: acyl-CoA/acyl-ACP dehydrogenase [Proteobacteria bacterium]|nr:acyl-CoA/acyl-ACP dehydrogenase [Pseudomonadota bacterium]
MEAREMGFSDEQKMIWKSCRDFVDGVIIPFIRENREREWLAPPDERLPLKLLEAADELGLRTLGVPERFGGMPFEEGTQAQTLALIAEEIGRGDSGFADKLVQNWKVSVLLSAYAPEHLLEEIFPRFMADPAFLMAHALTEPKGASDRWLPYNVPEANMDTRAVQDGNEWVLNGRKHFISNGYDASLYIVYANTNPSVGISDGTSSFIVLKEMKGFSVARANETIGCRYMNNGEIVLEDCRVPQDHLLVKDEALKKAAIYFNPGKILQAAKNLGVGMAALEDTEAYVQQHIQGGKPLIQHQIIAAHLADMTVKLEAVRAMVYRAARALDQGASDAGQQCLMVKVFASETVMEVAQMAMELHGGMGAMLEAGIEKIFRDASIFLHMDGTNDIHRFKIIRARFPETAGAYAG